MANLKIQRTDEYFNLIRDYKIYVDGKPVCVINNGKTKEIGIAAGRHTVTAKIDWCSSPDIVLDLPENETIELNVGSFHTSKWLMPFVAGLFLLDLVLTITVHIDYIELIALPLFFRLMYYLTFGRKKYLTLSLNHDIALQGEYSSREYGLHT